MTWFTWQQNNTNGVWKGPAMAVHVQAEDQEQAWTIARGFGVDPKAPWCRCCGRRWEEQPSYIGEDRPAFDMDYIKSYRAWSARDNVPLAVYLDKEGNVTDITL